MLRLLIISLLAFSCAHRAPESVKLAHVIDEKGVSTGMPNFVLSPELMEKSQSARAPASTMSDDELAQSLDRKVSLRRLYFRVVYQQWKELKNLSSHSSELKFCPSFHHDRVVLDESESMRSNYLLAPKPQSHELAFYPEWLLVTHEQAPVWTQAATPQEGLVVHTEKIHQELLGLCESGSSDAYYRLENMVTYRLKGKEYLKALLKIPAFSSMLLLSSVQSAPQRLLSRQDLDLINEVNGFQLQNYIVELRNQRQQLVIGALK